MARTRIALAANDPRHGTFNGYHNLGCRCGPCRAANATHHRGARADRQSRIDPDDPRHGTALFYQNWSCRCSGCRAAHTQERRSKKVDA